MSFPVKGFSLLELMVALVIISILTLSVVPSYKQYIARARFAEVILSTKLYQTSVMLAIQEGIELKSITNGKFGIPPSPKPTKNLANIVITKGIITSTASALLNHATYILKPDPEGTRWNVSGTCVTLGLCRE